MIDLYRHTIDQITIPSSRDPDFGVLKRVEDVIALDIVFDQYILLFWTYFITQFYTCLLLLFYYSIC